MKLAQMSCLFAELHRMATVPGVCTYHSTMDPHLLSLVPGLFCQFFSIQHVAFEKLGKVLETKLHSLT